MLLTFLALAFLDGSVSEWLLLALSLAFLDEESGLTDSRETSAFSDGVSWSMSEVPSVFSTLTS